MQAVRPLDPVPPRPEGPLLGIEPREVQQMVPRSASWEPKTQ